LAAFCRRKALETNFQHSVPVLATLEAKWLFLWTATLSFVRDRRLGWEHFSRRNFHLQRPPQKLEQHSDPFSCRQQLGDEHLESPKRSFYELNWLANFWGGIDSDDFFGARL
jgi:hypothetical protein